MWAVSWFIIIFLYLPKQNIHPRGSVQYKFVFLFFVFDMLGVPMGISGFHLFFSPIWYFVLFSQEASQMFTKLFFLTIVTDNITVCLTFWQHDEIRVGAKSMDGYY